MKKKKTGALKRKMLFGMLLILNPVLGVVTLLFWQTRSALKEEYIRTAHHDLREVSRNVDEKVDEVYAMSDVYAGTDEFEDYAETIYSKRSSSYKKGAIVRIHEQILEPLDRLNRREKLSAMYTWRGELLNFRDPNQDTEETKHELEKMQVNDPANLMQLIWYPARENFLLSDKPKDIHEKMAVFASRRVFSREHNRYEYVQIFALNEGVFYDLYKDKAKALRGEIYIIDGEGKVISSSDEEILKEGKIPERLFEKVQDSSTKVLEIGRNKKSYLVDIKKSEINDWRTIMVVPETQVTASVDTLYLKFFIILLVSVGTSALLITYLYRSFMEPINKLNISMKEVYNGNLDAYVELKEYLRRNEIYDMMVYYNSMLKRINTHIIEGLKADRKKKELELEVLMSQINPHFLYNTLENIVWKSNEAGRPDIGRMAASLGRMYRLSISGGQVIVPMEHEIEHLMAYVKIQKNRYGDSVEFELQTDMTQVHELYSLKILLQPIVENSFLYGTEGLERPMTVRLSIRKRDGWVWIRVIDNGCGMEKERLEQVRSQIKEGRKNTGEKAPRSTGIGLHSAQMRIRLYFGIEDAVSIYSKKGMGTLVVVKIPVITKEDVDENGNLKEKQK